METSETAIIEAKLIVDEAFGELFCEATPATEDRLRGMELLLHASDYLFDQIGSMYQDIWR